MKSRGSAAFASLSAVVLLSLFAFLPTTSLAENALAPGQAAHRVVEAYPTPLQSRLERRRQDLDAATIGMTGAPSFIIVAKLNRWAPGATIRVAFQGGDVALYEKIAEAAKGWAVPGLANVHLLFTDSTGKYLVWSSDADYYEAEIRIAFLTGEEWGGWWSWVGQESTDPQLSGAGEPSMNFDGFDNELPADWQGVVLHEFGHALGFQHEHQGPGGECDFRFEDDPGYEPTKDADGWFIADKNGRLPGMYTYLGGYSNFWPKEKVDENLREIPTSSAFLIGPFDKDSIMKYHFDAFMFESGADSPCYTGSENVELSDQDRTGARAAYPTDPKVAGLLIAEQEELLERLLSRPDAPQNLKASLQLRLESLPLRH